jgi:cell division protein YceG involved in septum cleavage
MPRIVKFAAGLAAVLVGLALFAGAAAAAVAAYGNSPPRLQTQPFPQVDGVALESPPGAQGGAVVRFDVRRGESAQSVGNRLAEAGLIRSRLFWNLLGRARMRFDGDHVRIGSYLIEVPATQLAIRQLLETGRDELLRVTVPEGVTVRETALIMEAAGVASAQAARMGGVFANRLDIGMMLQSCATVVYAITEELGRPHPNRLFYVDLEIRSPFNTYIIPGLPPAPIASPGLVALRAAFAPEASDYLFFRLVDEATGAHHFSRTMDEHARAGALFVGGGW